MEFKWSKTLIKKDQNTHTRDVRDPNDLLSSDEDLAFPTKNVKN